MNLNFDINIGGRLELWTVQFFMLTKWSLNFVFGNPALGEVGGGGGGAC